MLKDKILIVVPGFFFHIDEGAKNRINTFINTYDKAGYKVVVFYTCPIPCLKYWPMRKKYLNPVATWFMAPSFSYFRVPLLNKISLLIGQVAVFLLTHFNHYKFIQAEHDVGGMLCKYKKKRVSLIVDFHGDSADEFIFKHPMIRDKDWRLKFIRRANTVSIKKASMLLVVSENLRKELMKQTGLTVNNYFVLPCSVVVERFANIKLPQLNINKERIVVGYCGGLQAWQNIGVILDIVMKLRKLDERIFFLLLTPNPIDRIKKELDLIGAENYMYFSLKTDEVPAYLSLMDATFLIRDERMLNIVSSPTKIAESLAAGVPVIATKSAGDINEVVQTGQNGYIIKNINVSDKEISDMSDYLHLVKMNRMHYADLCKKSVISRNWANMSNALLDRIKEL